MALDHSDIEQIAWLARLALQPSEIPEYGSELGNILTLVEQMNETDTTSISPLAHPLEINARLRADKITETDHRTENQAGAPETEDGYYLVPRVIE